MKKTSIFLIVLIFCVVFSISGVVASDANDTSMANGISSNHNIQAISQSDGEDASPILQSDEDSEPVKKATTLTVAAVSGKENSKVNIKATVKSYSSAPVKNVKVTFKINGKTYSAKTNSKGVATVKVKIPKTKVFKYNAKTKNNIVTATTQYKKIYTCTAIVDGDDTYESSSKKFNVISKKNKKVQKYKITRKQVKTLTVPYKQWGFKKKTSGSYIIGILHEQLEGNRISIVVGDKILKKTIKFSSKVHYLNHGKKVYIPNNKWLKSKRSSDIHEYYYIGNAKMYVTLKYNANTYKKIK